MPIFEIIWPTCEHPVYEYPVAKDLIWCIGKLTTLFQTTRASYTYGNIPVLFTTGNQQNTQEPICTNPNKKEHTIDH